MKITFMGRYRFCYKLKRKDGKFISFQKFLFFIIKVFQEV